MTSTITGRKWTRWKKTAKFTWARHSIFEWRKQKTREVWRNRRGSRPRGTLETWERDSEGEYDKHGTNLRQGGFESIIAYKGQFTAAPKAYMDSFLYPFFPEHACTHTNANILSFAQVEDMYPIRASPPVRLHVRLLLYSRCEKKSRGTHGLTVSLFSRPAYFFFKNGYFVHK